MEETLINYQGVDVCHGETTILKDINLQVHKGEFVYLTGSIGIGKTSLLKTFYAELPVRKGTAEVLGRDMTRIKRWHVPALRRELGVVFQDFKLLTDRTVHGNLDFVLRATGWKSKADREKRIAEVLHIVELESKANLKPYLLSSGEQQRISIARAILNSPKIILADEATGNLDPSATRHTTRLLHELAAQGTAVVFSTHDEKLIEAFPATVYRLADHQLYLEDAIDIPLAKVEPEQ